MAYRGKPEYGKPRAERIRTEHLKTEETNRLTEIYAWLHAHPLLEQHQETTALGRSVKILLDILKQGKEKNGYTAGQLKLLKSIHASVGAYIEAGKVFYQMNGRQFNTLIDDLKEAIDTNKEKDASQFRGYKGWLSQLMNDTKDTRTVFPIHFGIKALLERLKKAEVKTQDWEKSFEELHKKYWEEYNSRKPT